MSNNNNNNNKSRKQSQQKAKPKGQAKKKRSQKGKSNAAFSAPMEHFAPVAVGVKMRKSKPVFTKSADHQRIVHREKIAKVISGGTGAFTILETLPINPGVAVAFPWLANQAAGYESYRFNRLRYVWVPSVGSAVAGNVIMGPDYDAADPAPASETALSAYTDSDEERIWCPLTVECTPQFLNGGEKHKYVRNGALAPNQDIKTYDSGNFFLAITDDAAAQTGKLWCEYDVSLFNPHVPSGGFFQNAVIVGSGGSFAVATIFGASPVSSGAPSAVAAANVVTITGLVIGQRYHLCASSTGTTMTTLSVAATSGMTVVSGPIASLVVVAATQIATWGTFTATAEIGVLTFTCAAATVTGSRFVLSVLAPAAF